MSSPIEGVWNFRPEPIVLGFAARCQEKAPFRRRVWFHQLSPIGQSAFLLATRFN
jgi:hypothetical protein